MRPADPIIARTLDFLRKDQNLLLVIVFGSAASGSQNSRSDIDVAVYPRKKITAGQRHQISAEIATATGRTVDLVDLSDADGGLLRQILRNGRMLFSKRPAILGFLTERMLAWQEDFEPQLNHMLASRINRFTAPVHGS